MLLEQNPVDSILETPASRIKTNVSKWESLDSRDRQNHRLRRILIRRDRRREDTRIIGPGPARPALKWPETGSLKIDAMTREAAGRPLPGPSSFRPGVRA